MHSRGKCRGGYARGVKQARWCSGEVDIANNVGSRGNCVGSVVFID